MSLRVILGCAVVALVSSSCSSLPPPDAGDPGGPDPAEITLELSPQSVTLAQGQSQQFIATVSGSDNKNVTWAASGGTVSGSGPTVLYTAPGAPGSYTLTATSQADPSKSASATITVQAVGVSISPARADLPPGGTQRFTAEVVGAADTTVSWSASGGSLSGSGPTVLYTAPATPGEYRVMATSNADASASAEALVVVAAPNQMPEAAFTATPGEGEAPLVVRFDASESTDPDGDITSYEWDFGDGSSGEGAVVEHRYEAADEYTVTLTVTDEAGAKDIATMTISVEEPGGDPGEADFKQTTVVTHPYPWSSPRPGHQLALEGDTLLVGLPYANRPADQRPPFGVVEIYERQSDGSWEAQGELLPPTEGDMYFGTVDALSGDFAGVASLRPTDPADLEYTPRTTVITIYQRGSDGAWSPQAELTAADFGGVRVSASVALGGTTLAALASVWSKEGELHASDYGIFIFDKDQGGDGNWGLVKTVRAQDYEGIYGFTGAFDLSEDGNTLIASRAGTNDGFIAHISTYIFERNHTGSNAWGLVKTLTPPNTNADGYNREYNTFGYVLALDGDIAVVGGLPEIGTSDTTVFIFERDHGGSGNWGERTRHVVQAVPGDPAYAPDVWVSHQQVAVDGDIAIASAAAYGCGMSSGREDCDPGRVYVFARDQGGPDAWGLAQVLQADEPIANQEFGLDVDVSAGTIVAAGYVQAGVDDLTSASFFFER